MVEIVSFPRRILLLLLLIAPLSSVLAQVVDDSDQPKQSAPAEKQKAPDQGRWKTETATGRSSGDVISAESEESGHEAKIKEQLPLEWKFYWHEGLHFWLQKKAALLPGEPIPEQLRPKPKLQGKIGSVLQMDAAAFVGGDDFEGFSDDIILRRFRLYTKGQFFLWIPVYFKFQFDITKDSFYLNDGHLEFRNIPWIQTFTVGYLKAPFSLERLESSRDTTFMERASPIDAFSPGFRPGFEGSGTRFGDRLTWALGWFADGADADIGDVTKSDFRIIGRMTGLPVCLKDLHNNRLMHVGLSYSYVNSSGNAVQYQSRPESRVAPTAVDTGGIPADRANLLDAEIAFVVNSLCFQGEYLHSIVNPVEGGTLHFNGYYAYVSYFPTGETRPYDTTRGIFTRVRPNKHFSFRNRTYGGLEIEARYSHLDLDDGDVNGGKMNIITAGVTWYLSPIFKLKFNYGNAYIDNREAAGRVNIFQGRFEIDL